MLLGERFQDFVKSSPISVMMQGIISYAFDEHRLDEVFENSAVTQYTRDLRFSTLARLMSEVVFDIRPSIHAACQVHADDIPVSVRSVYNKLNGIEPEVSAALVADSVRQLGPVLSALGASLPPLLPGYNTKILDGNHFAATEHRIGELRETAAAPLPGKALVVLDPRLKLATHVIPCEDGHAQERSLIPQVLNCVQEDDLWIEDRNFCTLGFLSGLRARQARYLVRQHGNLRGRLRGQRKYMGQVDSGAVYEQAIEVDDPQAGDSVTIRRITVELNKRTRNRDSELHLLTNLPKRAASARKVANLYRKRWTIETMFQDLTETLACEIKTLGYPKAAVFAFCLALVAYNGISVIKAALRSVHGVDVVEETVSGYYLSLEIAQTSVGMMIAIPAPYWDVFRGLSVAELAGLLQELARKADLSKYRKHPRGPKRARTRRTRTGTSNHVSTARILASRRTSS